MTLKVLRRTVVEKPVEDVIREFLEEGWRPITVKGGSAVFEINDEVLARMLKVREN
ncbi:MAG: hypothetical protein JW712_04555 [Dehalococcoidales bacterium]|nr:hypothetical protein [Dehalococcoidales bacterium]